MELLLKKEAKSKPLRTIGEHPESGELIEVWDGRYGPYVKHQRVNASLPKDKSIESVTLEEALFLLSERATKKKAPKAKAKAKPKAKTAATTAKKKPASKPKTPQKK